MFYPIQQALFTLNKKNVIHATNTHRLLYRLPGSLIRFAPYTFVPQRQFIKKLLPSPSVVLQLLSNATSTVEVRQLSNNKNSSLKIYQKNTTKL